MEKKAMKLSAPWYQYRNELAGLFELDKQVHVSTIKSYNGGGIITVSVTNHEKADALSKIITSKKDFGNYRLDVKVQDATTVEKEADILRAAFAHNRRVRGVRTEEDATGTEWVYLVMEPDVIQFLSDNLSDYHHNTTLLSANAAEDVLSLDRAFIYTADLTEN